MSVGRTYTKLSSKHVLCVTSVRLVVVIVVYFNLFTISESKRRECMCVCLPLQWCCCLLCIQMHGCLRNMFYGYSLSCHLIFVDVVVVVVIVLVVDLGIVVQCAYTHLYAITGTKCGFIYALWLCSGKGKQRPYIGISRFLFGLTKTSF